MSVSLILVSSMVARINAGIDAKKGIYCPRLLYKYPPSIWAGIAVIRENTLNNAIILPRVSRVDLSLIHI